MTETSTTPTLGCDFTECHDD